jgi:putative FmdB family regulatory protein
VPTYQYACTTCGNQLEVVQSFSDAALTECPVCDGQLRKVFSAVGIVFKGSGFYRTDSRAGSSATDSSTKSDGGKESTSTPAKSESTTTSTSTSTTSTTTTPSSSSPSSSSSSTKAAAS